MCATFQISIALLITLRVTDNWYELISGACRDSGNPYPGHYHKARNPKQLFLALAPVGVLGNAFTRLLFVRKYVCCLFSRQI